MSFLSNLMGSNDRKRDELRPLWHDVVAVSREREWYAACDVADNVEGRFDMISVVLALVLLRMEQDETAGPLTGLLTELFVADMDRQLRDTGVGDLMVGKKIGRLMSVLGGRIGVLREALANGDDAALALGLHRNVTLATDLMPMDLAARVRALHDQLGRQPVAMLLAGKVRG